MLVIILLCLAIAPSSWSQDSSIKEYNPDSMFGETYQLGINELGRKSEENLNCFLQFDQLLANNWTARFDLKGNINVQPVLVNRLKSDDETRENTPKARNALNEINSCMTSLTEKLDRPAIAKCMRSLVKSEIQREELISAPELFDNLVPLPFLTFLDIRQLNNLLFQNRTLSELSVEEAKTYRVASEHLSQELTERDRVFVIDQICEWKNLVALQNRASNLEDQLKEFTSQVIRSISLQVANAVFIAKDLKPGRWISVYRRWVPVRMKNLKELESIINTDLKTRRFPVEALCKYATVLASYFAQEEIKIIVPENISPLNMVTGDLRAEIYSEEDRLCRNGISPMCLRYRRMKESYDQDLRCVDSFGKLLSNHFLNSILEKYTDPEFTITYPERVCKKIAPLENIVVRYCRCVGSFCTYSDVGEIKANSYKFDQDTAVVTRL